jgi:type IV pilus assembly protein PilY1
MHRETPTMTSKSTIARSMALLARASAACALMLCAPAWAASADIANTPQASAEVAAKPNFMFILDDSGSMSWPVMPDDLLSSDRQVTTEFYGQKSPHCNGLAFDPDPTKHYPPPVRGDGSSYPNASFTAAWNDGFNIAAGTTNLSGSIYYRYNPSTDPRVTPPAAMSWTYTAAGVVRNDFYTECMTSASSASARFTSVAISAADQQKYANWYSYYRKRYLLMRTAAGLAFKDVTSAIRIGFTTISDTGVSGDKFLDVADFNSTHKSNFYSKLYSVNPNGSTPLRAAVSKTGRYFGNRITGQTDPVQHACQRNYALLSTDGYWNAGLETSSYGPFRLDGITAVGQQDATAARPMFDGATNTVITRTTVSERYRWSVNNDTRSSPCSRTQYRITVERQTRTDRQTTTNGVTAPLVGGNWATDSSSTRLCRTLAELAAIPLSRNTTYYSTSPTSYLVAPASGTLISDTSTTTSTGGSTDSLADVAQYYYTTDLRPELENIVPTSGRDTAVHQHLTLYTLGMGVNGVLAYKNDYLSPGVTSDYTRLVSGPTTNWPIPSGTTGGNANATHVDDLWHAAVNGRGQYYAARDATELATALDELIKELTPREGSAAAAAASALKPVTGDKSVYLPIYSNKNGWHGQLKAFEFKINTKTNEIIAPDVNADTPIWEAGALLNARTTARRILFNKSGTLDEFTYDNLSTAAKTHFDNRCTTAAGSLSQCPDLNATTVRPKVNGENLVKFLRGDTSLEMDGSVAADQVFRARTHLLGDLMNASPAFAGVSPLAYNDAGHAAHVAKTRERAKAIYAGANDGMLHAFDAATGQELWGFVPTAVMPELWRLADKRYDDNHRYYVDGSPTIGDVFDGTNWRTILVGGLGGGGRGYYALDITTPNTPLLLWEFTDTHMGLTYGNPVITKDSTGNWIVAFTSGYNNNTGGGDGVGRLYIVNAITGTLVNTPLSTFVGSTDTPSNLGKIEAWLDNSRNNTALRFYGGDMQGNLWRFDHDNRYPPAGREAFLLGQTRLTSGAIQPITTKPLIVATKLGTTLVPLVSVATGRYLGASDFANTTVQSVYTVKDSLTATGLGVIRSNTGMVKQTLGSNRSVTTPATVDWATKNGWYVDLDQSTKERVFVDGTVLFDAIAYASYVPTGTACAPDGTSYIYQFSVANGASLRGTITLQGVVVGVGAIVGGDGAVSIVSTTTATQKSDLKTHVGGSVVSGTDAAIRRSSWRELID